MKRNQSSLAAEGIAMARAMQSSKPADVRVWYDPYHRVRARMALVARASHRRIRGATIPRRERGQARRAGVCVSTRDSQSKNRKW
jgi:hypothetical protein